MRRLRDPKWALIMMFLGIIAAVPLIQTVIEVRQEGAVKAFEVFNELPTAANLRAYEKNLEKANWAGRATRPWLQFAHFALFKDGGEKVVLGSHEWYFYKPGLKYMLARMEKAESNSPTNDPVAAIVDFRDQLAARDIHLLVMPVPNKDS